LKKLSEVVVNHFAFAPIVEDFNGIRLRADGSPSGRSRNRFLVGRADLKSGNGLSVRDVGAATSVDELKIFHGDYPSFFLSVIIIAYFDSFVNRFLKNCFLFLVEETTSCSIE
jgi:hypothetical protein